MRKRKCSLPRRHLHINLSSTAGQLLPSLDARWRGFGGATTGDVTFTEEEGASPIRRQPRGTENRDAHLAYFFSQITPTPHPALHFLHVLLPHVPYKFLSSGHRYASESQPFPEGFVEGEEWIGEEPLLVTADHRNPQQVDYLDRFFGHLRKTLQASRLSRTR
jgi:hypothetical protein